MFIKMKSGVAGPKFTYLPGQTVDHPNAAEALRFIERGIAEAAPAPRIEPETAMGKPAPENALGRVARRRPRAATH